MEKQLLIIPLVFLLVFGVIAFVIAGPIAIVNAGERGVLTTFGQVSPDSLGEGLHWKIPIMQTVHIINVKTQKIAADASAASKDLQVVTTTVALNYRVTPESAYKLFQEIGDDYRATVIDPAIQEAVKAATARFTAEDLITQRPMVKAEIENALKERLQPLHIEVQNMSITNFDFSSQFNAAIEAKVTAEQDAFKAQKDLQRIEIEAQQRVTQAKAESDATKLNADALAYQKQEVAKAMAFEIEIQGKAIAEALKLQREQLNQEINDFKAIEKWNGELPTFMGSGVVPFLNVSNESSDPNWAN